MTSTFFLLAPPSLLLPSWLFILFQTLLSHPIHHQGGGGGGGTDCLTLEVLFISRPRSPTAAPACVPPALPPAHSSLPVSACLITGAFTFPPSGAGVTDIASREDCQALREALMPLQVFKAPADQVLVHLGRGKPLEWTGSLSGMAATSQATWVPFMELQRTSPVRVHACERACYLRDAAWQLRIFSARAQSLRQREKNNRT